MGQSVLLMTFSYKLVTLSCCNRLIALSGRSGTGSVPPLAGSADGSASRRKPWFSLCNQNLLQRSPPRIGSSAGATRPQTTICASGPVPTLPMESTSPAFRL